MAKCVQVVGQGVPSRLSDDDAFQIVERDHDGQYCSKAIWRNFYDLNRKPRSYVSLGKRDSIRATDEGFAAREAAHATT
jgi:hypothetical protein